jgi:hypothetical protein
MAFPLPLLQRLRWPTLFVASLLLHLLLFGWVDGRLVFPAGARPEPAVLDVALHAPPPPPRAAPEPKPKPPARKARPRRAPPPVAAPAAPVTDAVTLAPEPEATEASGAADAEAQDDTPPLAEVMPQLDYEPAAPRLLWQAVDLPPSAELRYDVVALKKEQHWYGNGVFTWESKDGGYRLVGEANASLLFFKITVLNFSSEGVINEYGIAPERYSEKPWRKPATNTDFRHAQHKILFSANNASHPYYGGEQDRASVLWQLAGIGRAAPERFRAGDELEVVVAGTRDARPWRIRILGQEQIETELGELHTWHLARVRPDGDGEQRIDVWLAPEQNWYPVKVRQTDADGDYLDLSLSKLIPAASTSAATAEPNRMGNE